MGVFLPLNNPGAFLSGIIGIIISAILYLIPLPTFYGVLYDEGRVEGLTPILYGISIFTCMLRIYYAPLK
ncbi:hypothetical protein J5N97_026518 [Dioscorea zingiberensis]|uniref:Uncharacterized protein n=1 Tax=Dioscorea zingiberensis TaxID=325984 RepID=A0A9D5C2X2_9LILI|nr:hypothetical protein J5N97_026518 [Dioscorea zingiberensis]